MSLSSLAAAFFGVVGFILFMVAGWLIVSNYETLFYETPESVGPNEHYKAEREFNIALWMYVIGIPFLVGLYLVRRPQRVKIVKEYKNRDGGNDGEKHRPEKVKVVKDLKNKDRGKDREKPIVYYYAKYFGLQGGNKSLPVEEDSYVYIYDDKIIVELLQLFFLRYKSKVRIIIPYSSVTNLQSVDARNKADLDRAIGLDSISARVGREVGLLRKRHGIVTIIKYIDEGLAPQVIALDFLADTKYAQPLIDKKMREKQQQPSQTPDQISQPLQDANQSAITSIADELSKLAKLKEQGIITEEDFLEMKNNLIKGSKN